MSSIPSREIQIGKVKLIFVSFLSLVLIAIGYFFIWVAKRPELQSDGRFLTNLVGWVLIVFSICMLILILKKLFTKNIGLIIDEKGITDRTYGYSVGLIKWQDIEAIEIVKTKMYAFVYSKALAIKVKDSQKYIEQAPKGWIQKILQSNQDFYKTPIALTSAPLKCSFKELEMWIREAWEMSKK